VAVLEETPGNVAISPEGRYFLSLHPMGEPEHPVVELQKDGQLRPYPFPLRRGQVPPEFLGCDASEVIGIECDARGVLWIVDMGLSTKAPKIIAWDTVTERLTRVIPLPPGVVTPQSFVQDLVVDLRRGVVVLADMGRADLLGPSIPAMIVVEIETGRSWRVLEGHPSLQAEDVPMKINGREVQVRDAEGHLRAPRLGLNPIALAPDGSWIYFGAMHGTSVYRIRPEDLLNPALAESERGAKVETYGPKPVSDGISVDRAGNVYITDVTSNALGVLEPGKGYRILFQDERLLSWADGLSYGPDGRFFVTVNQLHRHAALHGGEDATEPPFRIVAFQPLADSSLGR